MEIKKEILDISISNIIPNRFQPRLKFDENRLNELANSIRKYGIISPLLLRQVDNKYEIIAGERRFKAAKMIGLLTVPAMIATLTDSESSELALVENVQREDLSSLEEANSYNNLINNGNLTKEQVSSNIAKNQAFIDNKLKLLELSEETKQSLLNKLISEGHAKVLLKLNDKLKESEALNKIITDRLTVKETDDYIRTLNNFQNIENNDTIKLSELNKPEEVQQNISQALDNIDLINNKAVFEESQIDVKREENKMNNQENNGGLNSFSNDQINQNKFFNSLEDQSVNMGQPQMNDQNVGMSQLNNNSQYNVPPIQEYSNVNQEVINNQVDMSTSQISSMPQFEFNPMSPPNFQNNDVPNMGMENQGMMNNQPDMSQSQMNNMGQFGPIPTSDLGNNGVPSMGMDNQGMMNNQPDMSQSQMNNMGQFGSIPTSDLGNNGVPAIGMENQGMMNNQPDMSQSQMNNMGQFGPIPTSDLGNNGVPAMGMDNQGIMNNQPDMSQPQTDSVPQFQLPQLDSESQNAVPTEEISNPAVDRIKEIIQELQNNGFQIGVQESTTATDFQIVINIKKQ